MDVPGAVAHAGARAARSSARRRTRSPTPSIATLTYPEGFTVQLACTLNSQAGSESGIEILGSKASLRLRGDDVFLDEERIDQGGNGWVVRSWPERSKRPTTPIPRCGPRDPGQPAAGARVRRRALVDRRRGRHRHPRPRLPRGGEVAEAGRSRTRASAIAPRPRAHLINRSLRENRIVRWDASRDTLAG